MAQLLSWALQSALVQVAHVLQLSCCMYTCCAKVHDDTRVCCVQGDGGQARESHTSGAAAAAGHPRSQQQQEANAQHSLQAASKDAAQLRAKVAELQVRS